MFKKSICWFVTGLMVFGCLSIVTGSEKVDATVVPPTTTPMTYTPHAPIRINSDAEFTAQFANRTIWGLDITGSGYGCCIFIGNCSVPFTVKNCYLHDANASYRDYFMNSGLYLYKLSNGFVSNNNCSSNIIGILLDYSNNNTIKNNNCSANYDGIEVRYSPCNTLSNNNLYANLYDGIYIASAVNNTLINNDFKDCGLLLRGQSLVHYVTHNIGTDNTINGKPIRYVKNQAGSTVPSNAGAIIIVNCQYITIENQTLNQGTDGIDVTYSSNCSIINNVCIRNSYGIWLYSSSGNTLINNNCSLSISYGIILDHSSSNELRNNNCSMNEDGIFIDYESNNNIVIDNNCFANTDGISLGSHNNILKNNNCYANKFNGIEVSICGGNLLMNNTCYANKNGMSIFDAYDNTFTNNNITYNGFYGVNSCTCSRDNHIHNNYFIYNNAGGKQGYDDTGTNYWNTSTEGNYWSDWAFPDHNHDGIVDFPYNLDGGTGAKDFFPIADSNPPKIEILSPKNGETVNGNVTIDIKASDDHYLYFVNLSINGTIVDSKTDSFTYLWQTTIIANGIVNLSAEAMDVSNNHMWYNITVKVINNHAPDCTITYPTTGDVVCSNITVTGTASDPDGNSLVAGNEVKIDSGAWKPVIGTTSWSFAWDTTTVSDGLHTIYARAVDVNLTYSNPVMVTVTVGNIIKYGWIEGYITSDNSSGINATVTVNQTGSTTITDSAGQYNMTVQVGSSYDVRVESISHLTGYASGIQISEKKTTHKDFVLQYNGPNIIRCAITCPSGGTTVNETINISGSATCRISTIKSVQIRIGTGSWDNATGKLTWSYNWNTRTIANGNHVITVRASDGTTYSPDVSVTVIVSNDVLDKGNITVFVTDSVTKESIVSANVTIPSLGIHKTTDNSGYSNITNIPTGNYDITVSKTGYEDSTRSVTVNKTETTRINFYLVPITCIETKVMGKVVDNSTGNPIGNATIRIGNYTAKSGSDGKYSLKLPAGNYTLNVIKEGYKPYERSIHVDLGSNTIDIRLEPVELKKAPPDFTFFMLATLVMIAGVSVAFAFFAASMAKKKKKPIEITQPKETDETKEENHE